MQKHSGDEVDKTWDEMWGDLSELNLEELPFKMERPSNRTTNQLQIDIHRYLVFAHQSQSDKLSQKAGLFAQVGITEIQSRFNKKAFRGTLGVSIMSLIVAIVALFVSGSSGDNTDNHSVSGYHMRLYHMRHR